MASITIDGRTCEYRAGQTILQVANEHDIKIPQYCYHDGLSIVASCRICLAEVWQPNPRNNNALEPVPKLVPTCQWQAVDGMVVYTASPKAVANQKAVMEYLLINHPLDCPVCDQSGECFLQDYSYEYGRGVSRFEETKVKQPKKNLGPHVLLYADRCIMCSRCVRFTREVSGTSELIAQGRGNRVEIDIFPGMALDNPLSANVVDLCPVGALLEKDFLFAQRVWFLKTTPSIDGLTASGDNINIEHNQGQVYRVKPRVNPAVNKWWITDEVRFGWKFVKREDRLSSPARMQFGVRVQSDWERALESAATGLRSAAAAQQRVLLVVSPMLACEEAFLLAEAALEADPQAVLAVGPIPRQGENRAFPPTRSVDDPAAFVQCAEKAPNARGVRRVLEAVAAGRAVLGAEDLADRLARGDIGAAIITGNYPSEWVTEDTAAALSGIFTVLLDTLPTRLSERADVVLPSSPWVEKAGTFENWRGMIQAFEQAVPPREGTKPEGQIALDLLSVLRGEPMAPPRDHRVPAARRVVVVDEGPGQVPSAMEVSLPRVEAYQAGNVRSRMAERFGALSVFVTSVSVPAAALPEESDMEVVEL